MKEKEEFKDYSSDREVIEEAKFYRSSQIAFNFGQKNKDSEGSGHAQIYIKLPEDVRKKLGITNPHYNSDYKVIIVKRKYLEEAVKEDKGE